MTRHAVVIGLGDTGLSCVPFLQRSGYTVSVCDSRSSPPLLASLRAAYPTVPVLTGPFREDQLAGADILVVSPGVSVKEPALKAAAQAGVAIVGDIELFARACEAPVIAITGSNGKSTVTTLVGDMLRQAGLRVEVGGNIGVPVLTLLNRPTPDVYVLELSSFQLETTSSLNARAATVLNVTPDHMDRYDDLAEYAHAKARIFAGLGRMVVNREDPLVAAMVRTDRELISFGLDRAVGHDFGLITRGSEVWLAQGKQALMPTTDIPLPGKHNIANALAAFALATALSGDTAAMADAVRGFRGLAHRTQVVGARDDIVWIDDSKGTNVGATAAALAGLEGPVVLIAGGDGKGASFAALASIVRDKARAAVLIGRDAPRLADALKGSCPIHFARDMDDAVEIARRCAKAGDQVLLSPACASFDMFRNYSHRGDVFTAAVQRLILDSEGDAHG